jgi:hypothetical protein
MRRLVLRYCNASMRLGAWPEILCFQSRALRLRLRRINSNCLPVIIQPKPQSRAHDILVIRRDKRWLKRFRAFRGLLGGIRTL